MDTPIALAVELKGTSLRTPGPNQCRATSGVASLMTEILRSFEATDYLAARTLWETTPGVGLSDADEREPIEQFLARNPGLSFVAIEEGELVGTILCGHDGRRGLIHHLVTAQSSRRRGLGRQLLFAGLRSLRAVGINKCHLLVFRDNEPALAFWHAVSASERHELALFSISTESAADPSLNCERLRRRN